MNGILEQLSIMIRQSVWLSPLLALFAGILTSFTPCSLSTIPLIISYMGGTGQQDNKRALKLSVTFAVGSAVTFTILGVVVATAGHLMGTSSRWWYLLLGALMVLMALQTWGIFEIIPSSYLTSKNKKRGYWGAFIAGILGGFFSSPCSTPVLVALLAIVAGRGNVLWGVLLLIIYSIGHGLLAIIAGTSLNFVRKVSQSTRCGQFSNVLKIVMGGIILLIGFYMFYLGF
ncbi:MAG: cytochrome c biogenesis protein CcdA [Hespellia sp.]|nr:cytochrome c biogenesis protein CcdA [Hespellia sp.]